MPEPDSGPGPDSRDDSMLSDRDIAAEIRDRAGAGPLIRPPVNSPAMTRRKLQQAAVARQAEAAEQERTDWAEAADQQGLKAMADTMAAGYRRQLAGPSAIASTVAQLKAQLRAASAASARLEALAARASERSDWEADVLDRLQEIHDDVVVIARPRQDELIAEGAQELEADLDADAKVDAMAWAESICAHFPQGIPSDPGLMVGWFANLLAGTDVPRVPYVGLAITPDPYLPKVGDTISVDGVAHRVLDRWHADPSTVSMRLARESDMADARPDDYLRAASGWQEPPTSVDVFDNSAIDVDAPPPPPPPPPPPAPPADVDDVPF